MGWTLILRLLGYGWAVLVVALLVNLAAASLGGITWYGYVSDISGRGILAATSSLRALDLIFLFLAYPGMLGATVYAVARLCS